jgi:hypothetical protein
LRKAFDGWQIPDDPKSGAVLGGLQGAEAHYKKLSEKFGYSIPVPEQLINQKRTQQTFTTVLLKPMNAAGESISQNRFTTKHVYLVRRTTIRIRRSIRPTTNAPTPS